MGLLTGWKKESSRTWLWGQRMHKGGVLQAQVFGLHKQVCLLSASMLYSMLEGPGASRGGMGKDTTCAFSLVDLVAWFSAQDTSLHTVTPLPPEVCRPLCDPKVRRFKPQLSSACHHVIDEVSRVGQHAHADPWQSLRCCPNKVPGLLWSFFQNSNLTHNITQ